MDGNNMGRWQDSFDLSWNSLLMEYHVRNHAISATALMLTNSHHCQHWRWSTFFKRGILCSIQNTKFWPILAILSQIYTLLVYFTGPNNAAAILNSKNIRYALSNAPDLPSHDVKLHSLFKGSQNRKPENDDRKVPTRELSNGWMGALPLDRQIIR